MRGDSPADRRAQIILGIFLGSAVSIILLALISCGRQPEPIAGPETPVPAQVRADDLATQEREHRLAIAEAKSKADQAAKDAKAATNDAAKAKAERERIAAEAEIFRQTLLAGEVETMRHQAEAEAVKQRGEIEDRATRAEAAAFLRHQQEQAASDRRWAIIGSSLACAAACGVAFVLWRIGVGWHIAASIPGTVSITAAVGVGILSAGPWLGYLLGAAVSGAAIAGLVYMARALWHTAKYGEIASKLHPGDHSAFRILQDEARKATESDGVRGLVLNALTKVREG